MIRPIQPEQRRNQWNHDSIGAPSPSLCAMASDAQLVKMMNMTAIANTFPNRLCAKRCANCITTLPYNISALDGASLLPPRLARLRRARLRQLMPTARGHAEVV